MKQVKKCLGILLVVAMCLNMLVMSALAVEDAAEGDNTEQTATITDGEETAIAVSPEDGDVEEGTDDDAAAADTVEDGAEEDAADETENDAIEEDASEDDTAVTEKTDADSMLTAVSAAEESEDEQENSGELIEVTVDEVPDASGLADSDELFAAYVNRLFYSGGISLMANYGENYLSGANLEIYNQLKAFVKQIASGEVTSTVITIDVSEMGITYDASTVTFSGFDRTAIIYVLQVDCPYELYWFDKTAGWTVGWNRVGNKVTSITFKFSVSSDYAGDGDYTTDGAKTSAASTAAANALSFAYSCSSLSDYDKLVAFKDYICEQVSYNYDAADSSTDTAYGDPWQLIYVFDGDDSTNVVCEGYAKAFQYLCDIWCLTCYTVTGTMTGGTGAGSHMWNLVELDGYIYLADITLSDSGSVGAYGDVFLVGSLNGTADGYTINIPSHDLGDGRYTVATSVTYTYDENTVSLYSEDIRTLAMCSYNAHTAGDAVIENETEATCSKEGSYDSVVYCSVCGGELSRETFTTVKLEHTVAEDDAVAPTCTEDGLTAGSHCSVCGEVLVAQETIPATGHSYDEGVVTKEAACTENGEITYTCAVCGATETETIEATGHTAVEDSAVAATCTEDGLTAGSHCSVCGAVLVEQETVPATGHSWDDGAVVEEVTCTEDGEIIYTCTVCGETKVETIAATGHTAVEDAAVAATCT